MITPMPGSLLHTDIIKMGQEEVFWKYLEGEKPIGPAFSSPYREDRRPSCRLFYGGDGVLKFQDFSLGLTKDCVGLVMWRYGLSAGKACEKIYLEVFAGREVSTSPRDITPKRRYTSVIEASYMDFDKAGLRYWESLGITREILANYKVSQCKMVHVNGQRVYFYTVGMPVFCYDFGDSCKIYMPYSPTTRFLTNSACLQGLEQLSFSGPLFVTKSLKDVMCLRSFGIDAVAPQSETTMPNLDSLVKLYDKVFVMYDYDYAGVRGMNRIKKAYGAKPVYFARQQPAKDLSDVILKTGRDQAWTLLRRLTDYAI
jgi:hypothetical protein